MSGQLSSTALDLLPDPVLLVSLQGDIVGSNRAARGMLEPVLGRSPTGLALASICAGDAELVARSLRDWARSPEMTPGSLHLLNPGARRVKFEVDACALRRPDEPTLIVIRFRRERLFVRRFIELTERIHTLHSELASSRTSALKLRRRKRKLEQANRRLQQLATQDSLTRLANRRAFDQALFDEWARAIEQDVPIALIMLDVDHFKHFNDSYGHAQGDRCLQLVAHAIARRVRLDTDFAARYGGEEFAVLLPETPLADAARVARRILRSVRALGIVHEGSGERGVVTISAGVSAVTPGAGDRASMLIEAADLGLYDAKEEGRDRLVVRFLNAGAVETLESQPVRAA